jgi:hypothetical protein
MPAKSAGTVTLKLWPVTVDAYVSRLRLRAAWRGKDAAKRYAGPWARRVFQWATKGARLRSAPMEPGRMVRLPELASLITPHAPPWFRVDAVGWERGGRVAVHLS